MYVEHIAGTGVEIWVKLVCSLAFTLCLLESSRCPQHLRKHKVNLGTMRPLSRQFLDSFKACSEVFVESSGFNQYGRGNQQIGIELMCAFQSCNCLVVHSLAAAAKIGFI